MRVLFACIPADGHFNPLSGLAVQLRAHGHDVRWYTGPSYAARLQRLGIPHLPFVRATDINGDNLAEYYPEYAKLGLGPKAIAFALEKVFFVNLEAHLHDILELHRSFAFDAIVFDAAFYAGRLVAEKLGIPAYPLWAGPSPAPTSKTAPPPFFGLRPRRGPFGKLRDALVTAMVRSSTKGGMKIWHELREREGLSRWDGSLFDIHNETSAALFMVGAPGMDFPRQDWPERLQFVGALLSARPDGEKVLPEPLAQRLRTHEGPLVVVAQGTIDNRDPDKLIVPTLTALSGSPYLVVATTGGRHTAELRQRFSSDNVMVEDFVDYGALMPHAAVFVSNGGYGSVMQALVNGVPVVLAGKLEGKNDINARLAYRGLGLDLCTERPTVKQIRRAVDRVLTTPSYGQNVASLQRELAAYDGVSLIEQRLLADTRAE